MKSKTKYLLIALGVFIGALSGFFYWKFVGCENGCAIKSVWWRMTLWAALMGGLFTSVAVDFYEKYKLKSNKKS